MAININVPAPKELRPRIVVLGVGGAGGNAVNNMIVAHLEGVEFVVANTDAQALAQNKCPRRIQLGAAATEGLGAGAQPDVGRLGAEESLPEILEALSGAHMVFITAGMGGGTGTGAAPVIARAVREAGILTVGVVTKPFSFEGDKRMRAAERGIAELQAFVHTLIVIPNQNLFRVANDRTTFAQAFAMADEVLHAGVRGVTDLIVMPGLINLDFADIKSVISEMGKAMMGTGEASGDNRAIEAAEKAIANPLLDGVSMRGARGVIISITGGEDMRLMEVDEAASHIKELVDPDANIIWGSAFNNDLEGKIRVSVVATGIDADAVTQAPPQPAKVFAFPGAARNAMPEAPRTTLAAPEAQAMPLAQPTDHVAPPSEQELAEAASETDELTLDTPAVEGEGDELLLDTMMDEGDGGEGFTEDDLTGGPEASAPGTRSWITGEDAGAAKPAPREGGTLFERMSNIARGAAKAQVEEEPQAPARTRRDPLDIPRFLGRQNNQ
ncbi:MAG: cell division protein FtsZ [Alphaproteobacteria bacterium]|nr:cell division protein FtsZ [Alphaproteobacteria bacterium]